MELIKLSLSVIQAKLVAPKGQFNSFGKYKYRNCEDILEAVKPLLLETGTILTLTDDIILVGERYYVKATATLTATKADESISVSAFARESENKKGMDESQITGSSSSYARKYALNGLFQIDDTKDADTKENATETISDADLSHLRDLLNSFDGKEGALCKFLKIEQLEDMRASDFKKALSAVEAKKKESEK